ncbi:vesicle coat component, partial [Ascosphaera pollenicola]
KFKEVLPDGLAALSAAAEQLAPLDTTTAQNQTQRSAPVPSETRPPSPSDSRAEPPAHPPTTVSAHSPTPTTTSSTTFTPAQSADLSTLPSRAILKRILAAYTANNQHLMAEIDALKSKNVALGDTYRRIVMACTGWTAKQVDEAAEGLTECVKEINESPVPEEEAIEILMKERGQDW